VNYEKINGEVTINGAVFYYCAELEAIGHGRAELLSLTVEDQEGDAVEDDAILLACERDARSDFNTEPYYALPRREWQG